MFSSVTSSVAVAEQRHGHAAERLHRGLDADDVVAHADRLGAGLGVFQRMRAGVGRRHHQRVHALGPQRIGRHRGGQRRIDAARQADHDRREARLVHVVAQAQHHRLVDRFDVAELRRDRAGLAFPAAAVAAELDGRDLLAERGELGLERAVGAERERAAVVDHLVLAADLVEIDQRQAALDHAVDGELHAHVGLADLVGRGVGHQQDLAAGLGDAFDDVGRPDVLADRHADAHALDHQRPRHRARREDALVVEHAVVRQVDLVALADDLAFVEADDGVVELAVLAPRRGDEQRRPAVPGVGAQFLDRLVAALHERRLQHQVLGEVSGEDQLGRQHQVGALLCRLGARGPHLGEIACDVADLGIELGERDLERLRHPLMLFLSIIGVKPQPDVTSRRRRTGKARSSGRAPARPCARHRSPPPAPTPPLVSIRRMKAVFAGTPDPSMALGLEQQPGNGAARRRIGAARRLRRPTLPSANLPGRSRRSECRSARPCLSNRLASGALNTQAKP